MERAVSVKWALVVLVAVPLFCGAVTAGVEETATYQGNKARVVVGTIKSKADDCTSEMAASIGEMLSTALANNEKLIVLASQEEVAELAEEIELGESEYVEEGRGPDKGLMEGADILVTGAVTAFEPEASGGGGGLGGLTKKAFGKVGVESKTAKIIMDIKLVDIRTRRILKAKAVEAKSASWSSDMAGGGWSKDVAMAGELGAFSNEPMEKAIRVVLTKTVDMVAKEIPKEYYRYQGQGQYTKEYGVSSSGKTEAGEEGGEGGGGATVSRGGGPVKAENMGLYTKYDFVPGDRTIFYDDLSKEEVGEFPSRWSFGEGVFEVARKGDRNLVMCSDQGRVRPKTPSGLPDRYTVEWEIYSNGADLQGHYYYLYFLDANEKEVGSFVLTNGISTSVSINRKEVASKDLPSKLGKGIHTLRVMATKTTMKCYVDNERVANVPDIEYFEPVGFELYCDPWDDAGNPMLFGRFRLAEGGKSLRQQLDETGKIITHGILFDSGSDVIKAESYKTLSEIGQLLTDDPALRLSIEGHTDSDNEETANQDLSERRAASVRAYLADKFQVDPSRLETKGFGESKPIDSNTTPEGKANNRRVELVKLS